MTEEDYKKYKGVMKSKLKVIYDAPIDSDLDVMIEEAMAKIGFGKWASGVNLTNGERDLSFDRVETKKSD